MPAFRKRKFTDRFPAMNPEQARSGPDPLRTISVPKSRRSPNSISGETELSKAAITCGWRYRPNSSPGTLVNDRFAAIKLNPKLPQLGQQLPATLSPDRTPEEQLHIDTCRKGYSGSSVIADSGALRLGRQVSEKDPS
jgi:hypothetical protein